MLIYHSSQLVLVIVFLLLSFSTWWSSSLTLVQLGDDWLHNVLHLLLLSFQILSFRISILLQPFDLLIDNFLNFALLIFTQFSTKLLLVTELILQAVSVAFQFISGFNLALESSIFLSKLFSIIDHSLNVFGAESVVVVCDGDLLLVTSALVLSRHNHDTVSINLKGDFNLRNTSWCWWDSGDVELSKKMVVLGHGSLSLVDLDGDGVLVVGGGGEDLALLGGDDGVPGHELGHDSSNSLNTEGEWVDVKKNNISSILFTRQHTSLDSSSVGNSFIRVDSLAWFLSIEEFLDKLLNLVDRLQCSLEQIHVQFLKFGSGKSFREIFSLKHRFNLNSDLVSS